MPGKIEDIEILRGYSIMAVLLQHLDNLLPNLPPALLLFKQQFAGGFGVDMFLAISGYLVAYSLLAQFNQHRNFAQQKQLLKAFWLRRAWRLWPAAWLWLTIILLCVTGFNHSGAFGTLPANLDATLAGFFHYANFRFAHTFMQSEYGASFVFWSLSLEEQCYFILPLLLLIFRRYALALLITLALAQLFTPRSYSLPWIMLRTDGVILGVLIAYLHHSSYWPVIRDRLLQLPQWFNQLTLICALALLAALSGEALAVAYKYSWLALISAYLVLIATLNSNTFIPYLPLKKALLWLGQHAYSIYLAHIPVYFAIREMLFRLTEKNLVPATINSNWLALAMLCVLLPAAVIGSYALVENPLRRYGRRYSEQQLKEIRLCNG